jgi:predicted transposase YbfD/YdcC
MNMTPSPQKAIAIDGKSLRRSHDRKNKLGALFLVSAWSVENGVSLGQLATEAKSNEITAIPELIDNIDVSGAIVTIERQDVRTLQHRLSMPVVTYLYTQGQQGNFEGGRMVSDPMANGFGTRHVRIHQSSRAWPIDTLTYYHCKVPAGIPAAQMEGTSRRCRHSESARVTK